MAISSYNVNPDNYRICTSGARPTTDLYEGVMIHETDTNRKWHYNGSIWVPLVSYFRGNKNVDQSIADTTATDITWADVTDTDGWHAGTSASIIVPTGYVGVVSVTAIVRFASNATGYRAGSIIVDGATTIARQQAPATSGQVSYANPSAQFDSAGGEIITIVAVQTSTAALNVEATHSTVMVGFRLY